MRIQNPLFCKEDLDGELRARKQKVAGIVDGIAKEQFLVSSDQELIDYAVARLAVEPIVLCEGDATMSQQETQIDVSRDSRRDIRSPSSMPFYIAGTEVNIGIPFTGDEWIFQYRTNPWSPMVPRAEIQRGRLRLSISQPHDADRAAFKSIYEQEIKLIRECVDRAHKQVVGYNESLPNLVQQAINHRRDRLGRHDNIAALLDIPLVTRPGAPSIAPVKVNVRCPPSLPVPPKTGLVPEPGIADETFEHILQFIRHQGRTFERTPSTYAVHDEEDLRNIVLAQLNGHFHGDAVGEVFRCKGKTDICIEQDNRAAFVGECKLWTGPAGLTDALDQLLSYLTWRDSKAALIMFNAKNKDFSKILETMPKTLRAHPLFHRDIPCGEAGEWRVFTHSAEDVGRRVTVHAFAFNLYQNLGPRVLPL